MLHAAPHVVRRLRHAHLLLHTWARPAFSQPIRNTKPCCLQAVGPVAVTSILLGNGLASVFSDQKDQVGVSTLQGAGMA